jgi:hypothetical protein
LLRSCQQAAAALTNQPCDTITILRSYSGQPQTKTIKKNSDGNLIAVPHQNIKYFVGSAKPVHDVYSVAAVLEAAATDARNCVVRGEIIETVDRSRMLRRSVARPAKSATATTPAQAAEPATLRTVKRHWVLIDVDDYPLPPAFDQFADPSATVALIAALLPPEFQGATLWWSFTSSAGTNPKLSIRLGFWLSRPLGRGARHVPRRQGVIGAAAADAAGEAIEIARLRNVRPEWLARPMLHLDATLDVRLARVWAPMLELKADIQIKNGPEVTLHQILDLVSYARVVPGSGAKPGSEKYRTQTAWMHKIMRRLEVICAEARERGGAVGCNAPLDLERQMLETWKAWGTLPANLLLGHFNALRGVNTFERVTDHVVISRPLPPSDAVEALYRLWYNRHPKPSLHGGPYPMQSGELRSTGNDRIGVEGQPNHPDPNCDAILKQISGAELVQAVHRARLLRRGALNPLQVHIVTNTATDIPIDTVGTLADWVKEADPERVMLARGFWSKNWKVRAAVLQDMFPTVKATQHGFRRLTAVGTLGAAVASLPQTPIEKEGRTLSKAFGENSPPAWPEYRCGAAEVRQGYKVHIDPALHRDARSAWERRWGAPLDSFEPVSAKPEPRRLKPEALLPAAPSVVSDILATPRRGPDAALPWPIAPEQYRIGSGLEVRRWPDDGQGSPILMKLRPRAIPAKRPEPVFTVDDLRARAGVSPFAMKNAMGRARYRNLKGEARERAELEWLMNKVGREKVASIARDMRQAAA